MMMMLSRGVFLPLCLPVLFLTATTVTAASPLGTSSSAGRRRSFASLDLIGGASRILAKDEKEGVNRDVAPPISQTMLDKDREAPLLQDLELLSKILSELVDSEDPVIHDYYEEFRQYGLDRASDPNNEQSLQKMIRRASELTADQLVGVTRTFSIMLNLVNSAEVHHRQRVTRQHDAGVKGGTMTVGPLPMSEDSMRGTMDALLKNGQASKQDIYNQLLKQKVEIVLTAHPTEVQRKSLLRKYRKISEALALLERSDLDGYAKEEAVSSLRRIISSVWGADEIRRNKPTPQQEAAGGNAIIESVLWHAVPSYLKKLQTQCQLQLGMKLPVDVVPIKFASWIGGDRDGKLQMSLIVFFGGFL